MLLEIIGGLFGGLVIGVVVGLVAAAKGGTPAPQRVADDRPAPKPAGPSAEPVRLLALLQQDARLVDFLMEDVGQFDDAAIGASVRDIHAKAREALKKYLVVEPIRTEDEGSSVTVPAGFDPATTRVVGNVGGSPPFSGTLVHRGWKVDSTKIPPLNEGMNGFILAPAEVEVV